MKSSSFVAADERDGSIATWTGFLCVMNYVNDTSLRCDRTLVMKRVGVLDVRLNEGIMSCLSVATLCAYTQMWRLNLINSIFILDQDVPRSESP